MAKKKSDGTDDTSVDPGMLASDDTVHDVLPDPAAARLKAFEDEYLAVDGQVVRINGHIERGVGSMFAKLTDAQRRQHAALEKLVAAEAALEAAHAALIKADTECEAAAKEASDAAGA